MKKLIALLLFSSLFASSAFADDSHHKAGALSDGEIRKVDKDAGKLTIKHGEIKNLEMPPMTMVFRVKDQAMLEQVKAGDKVRFEARKIDGAFTVTAIQPAN